MPSNNLRNNELEFYTNIWDSTLSGREIDKTGFGLCHSGLWTFLDVFVSRLLQICAGFGLVSDDQIFWRAHQIC